MTVRWLVLWSFTVVRVLVPRVLVHTCTYCSTSPPFVVLLSPLISSLLYFSCVLRLPALFCIPIAATPALRFPRFNEHIPTTARLRARSPWTTWICLERAPFRSHLTTSTRCCPRAVSNYSAAIWPKMHSRYPRALPRDPFSSPPLLHTCTSISNATTIANHERATASALFTMHAMRAPATLGCSTATCCTPSSCP